MEHASEFFPVDIGKTTTTLPSTSHFSLGGADSILDILVLRLSKGSSQLGCRAGPLEAGFMTFGGS